MQLCVVVILSMYAHIAVVSNMCSKYVESALRSNYVNNSASNRYFLGTDTNQNKGVNSVDTHGGPEDLNCFIRNARFVTIFLQDHALEVIVSTHM
jgi:hypothetical protein